MRRTAATLATLVAVGNVAILAVSALVRRIAPNAPLPPIGGIKHLHAVDGRVWRSNAPSQAALAVLADRGVRTVVDLRAERDLRDDEQILAGLGVKLLRLPIRDGQAPTPSQVGDLLAAIGDTAGLTLIHCGAGVGRTGTMVGAYVVSSELASPWSALRSNLAVGPPSLEQIWYVARLGHGTEHGAAQPPLAVKVVSRVLDAPRRTWSRVRHARHPSPAH